MTIPRYIEKQIFLDLGKKIVLLYGPRQIGKTTIGKRFFSQEAIYYNCDEETTRSLFARADVATLGPLVERYNRIIIDEAQRVEDIGIKLKILYDVFPKKQFLVTGSSSFDLAKRLGEPLTGRTFIHLVYPISLFELQKIVDPVTLRAMIPDRLIYGSYPEIITTDDYTERRRIIEHVTEHYLFKDILEWQAVHNSNMLRKLLTAVALQVGHEVSYTELASTVGIDKKTVERYIDICEKAFILFSLRPYTSNKRKSISKRKKYFFFDLGIRNTLIQNFNPLELRSDVGALWENFVIRERMAFHASRQAFVNFYFWRSYDGHEVDLIEEENGIVRGLECKWSKSTISKATQKIFFSEFGGQSLDTINQENIFATVYKKF